MNHISNQQNSCLHVQLVVPDSHNRLTIFDKNIFILRTPSRSSSKLKFKEGMLGTGKCGRHIFTSKLLKPFLVLRFYFLLCAKVIKIILIESKPLLVQKDFSGTLCVTDKPETHIRWALQRNGLENRSMFWESVRDRNSHSGAWLNISSSSWSISNHWKEYKSPALHPHHSHLITIISCIYIVLSSTCFFITLLLHWQFIILQEGFGRTIYAIRLLNIAIKLWSFHTAETFYKPFRL